MALCLSSTYLRFVCVALVVLLLSVLYTSHINENKFIFSSQGQDYDSKMPKISPINAMFTDEGPFLDIPADESSFTEATSSASTESFSSINFSESTTQLLTTEARILEKTTKTNESEVQEMPSDVITYIMDRFASRKNFLENKCSQYRDTLPRNVKATNKEASYYVGGYKLFFCVSAKGGATTWKSHMLRMKGAKARRVHKGSSARLIRANPNKIDARIKGQVTSVISVRHPLARLVSAYGDKFGDGVRTGAKRFVQTVNRFFHTKGRVPFERFLQYVIYQGTREPPRINNHWRPISWNCNPCTGSYDYVIKLETMENDFAYLVNITGITGVNVHLRWNVKHSNAKVHGFERYFESLSPKMLSNIYNIYKYDFLLFDYEVPKFMLDAVTAT